MILKLFGIEIRTGADLAPPAAAPAAPQKVEVVEEPSKSTDVVVLDRGSFNPHTGSPRPEKRRMSRELNESITESIGDFFNHSGIKMATTSRGRNRKALADSIVYPAPPHGSTPLQVETHYATVQMFVERLKSKTYFDICSLDKLTESSEILNNPTTRESANYLRSIHCKDYADMDDRQYVLMIACLKHILSEGETTNPNTLLV